MTIGPGEDELDLGDQHAPGQPGIVVLVNPETGYRELDELTWGMLPHDTADPVSAPRPIHARAETIAELAMFADAFLRRRCIVPVDAYFRRKTVLGRVQRVAVSRVDGKPMAWAGLWEAYRWPSGKITRTYCVVTVLANPLLVPLGTRMPVVLEETDWPVWLGEQPGDRAALLRPAPDGVLHVWLMDDTRK